jgi:hypothetical protein
MFETAREINRFQKQEVALGATARQDMTNRRNTNRKRLKNGLKENDDPKPIGCHTQGSYKMWTMVQDAELDYDIDDGVYFHAADLVGDRGGEMSSKAVRDMVCEALQDDKFTRAPEALKNCVRVYYGEGYHVDVPAYRQIEKPDVLSGSKFVYELAGANWRQSDPREVTNWFIRTNADLSPDGGDGQFRRVVRLLMFSKSRPTWKSDTLSGFALTVVASERFHANGEREDVSLRETMKSIAARLEYDQSISHPVLDEKLTQQGDASAKQFRDRLKNNLAHLDVLDDPDCDHETAMKAWDKVFNRSWFCDQPPPTGSGTPTKAVVKEGDARYANPS